MVTLTRKFLTDSRLLSPITQEVIVIVQTCSLSFSFPFVRGEVLPATFSPPHLIVFSTLLCLLSSSSSLPPLLPSSHLSQHSPPISALASLVSSCLHHISLNTVLLSQPWPPSSPPALLT